MGGGLAELGGEKEANRRAEKCKQLAEKNAFFPATLAEKRESPIDAVTGAGAELKLVAIFVDLKSTANSNAARVQCGKRAGERVGRES